MTASVIATTSQKEIADTGVEALGKRIKELEDEIKEVRKHISDLARENELLLMLSGSRDYEL